MMVLQIIICSFLILSAVAIQEEVTNDLYSLDNNNSEYILETEHMIDPYKIDLSSINLFNTRVSENKIINGLLAPKMAFYYQVAMYVYGKSGTILFCGGSLISNNFVLTAAHCVDEPIQKILVILGNNDLSKADAYEVRTYVKKYIVHSNFDSKTLKNDICLLELIKPVEFNDAIGKIALPEHRDDGKNYINKIGIVSGFGKVRDGGSSSNTLMYLRVRVMNNYLCNHIYYDKEAVYTNICTSGYGFIGACQGDSGGPLVIDNKLMGIVSFGSEECTLAYPTVYTRVSAYLYWIAKYSSVKIQD